MRKQKAIDKYKKSYIINEIIMIIVRRLCLSIIFLVLTVLGLTLFEIICSIDNAIINAQVLSNMSLRARKWFLIWGLLISVFIVRGMLPWLIVWLSIPDITALEALITTFSSNPSVETTIKKAAPNLLMGGGIFLIFIFMHWLFRESKNATFAFEEKFINNHLWFYTASLLMILTICFISLQSDPVLIISALIGTIIFFITEGIKKYAEARESSLSTEVMSDLSKILYLEVIDASFSVDSVLGAFAFTLAIPLILIGNGIGALVVREFTVRSINSIKKYHYLQNGAMYSLLFLGSFMILEGFKIDLPEWISPITTFTIVGYFFYKSKKYIKHLP